tara:strand:+ start:346 stop:513 length:168 start_codon:yes stop_codon:yes gene_type:complete
MIEFIVSNWLIILLLIALFLIVLKYTKGNTKNYKELLNQGAIIIDVREDRQISKT